MARWFKPKGALHPKQRSASDAMARLCVAFLLASSAAGNVLRSNTSAPCPSSAFYCGATLDAAGAPIYQKYPLTPETCTNIGAKAAADQKFKLCGPGKWVFAALSCERHDYKKVVIEQPTNAFTVSDCKVYTGAALSEINGIVGSTVFSFSHSPVGLLMPGHALPSKPDDSDGTIS